MKDHAAVFDWVKQGLRMTGESADFPPVLDWKILFSRRGKRNFRKMWQAEGFIGKRKARGWRRHVRRNKK